MRISDLFTQSNHRTLAIGYDNFSKLVRFHFTAEKKSAHCDQTNFDVANELTMVELVWVPSFPYAEQTLVIGI